MKTIPFTQEQLEILRRNPYTEWVSPQRIHYTMDFKIFALKESNAGVSSVKIFEKAGYDPEILGKQRIYCTIKKIRQQAASPEGLQQSRGAKSAKRFATEELNKKKNSTAIKQLQDRIVYLEQEIEFLKKISLLDQQLKQDRNEKNPGTN